MSESYTTYSYLIGAMAQKNITSVVRSNCIPQDSENLEQILSDWRKAIEKFRKIESEQQGLADNNIPTELEMTPKLKEIQDDPLFKNSFSAYPSEFKMIDVDNLIAPQRRVSLDYADQLFKKIPDKPSMDYLIDFCISPKQDVPTVKDFQIAENTYQFSSPSVDFRFLGGFRKKSLSDDDIKYCLGGGLPVGAIILFYGYGAGSLNVLKVNNRLILNNGFHRVYALRKKGITKIPAVIQNIGNPAIEMASNIQGLSQDYLLKHPRPILLKDFFEDKLITTLRLKNTIRTVRIQWGIDQTDTPV